MLVYTNATALTFIIQEQGIYTPVSQGCQLDFINGFNNLVVYYCNAQSALLCISHNVQSIKIK